MDAMQMKQHLSRPVAAAGAILTCPCHVPIVALLLSGSALGVFLFRHLILVTLIMGGLFALSLWLLWQTRDSRTRDCASCSPGE